MDPDSEAKPYGLLGLCLSLLAILGLAVLIFLVMIFMALVVDAAVFGFRHPFTMLQRLAAGTLSLSPELESRLTLGAGIVLYIDVIGAVLALARWRGGAAWRDLVAWRPLALSLRSGRLWRVIGLAALLSIGANAALSYFHPESKSLTEMPKDQGSAALLLVLAAGLAPFAEELVFRGWIYTSLRASFGLWPALLLSSAAFALAHYENTHLYALTVFPVGIGLGLIRERAGSTKASAAFHGFYNFVAWCLAYLDIG
jgi:membrane protease YdiL (CAAX protease family)